ncbi:YbaK/EbsC family protein [Halococcus dombrowskii]|uniref:YbaK/EbsC family protein n=1 Tax=Halococcus dombrowskii TaxID=179637 RepID=A0AAV3SB14_HALDO|nr:YbaK/EbsC family protein [Halococcus dombrowskii]UOO94338.1 YbaK/EbsC family protein [Halococcus dombrowskii]
MHRRAAAFAERAEQEYGIAVDVHEFPDGTRTASAAAAAIGCDVAQIASSLVFVTPEPVVVVTSGANRVSEDKLATVRDVDENAVAMADADTVRETVGWSIGGVPPFCHDTSVPVYLDEALQTFDTVWAAAGTPEAVFPIAPERLRELADARPVNVAE